MLLLTFLVETLAALFLFVLARKRLGNFPGKWKAGALLVAAVVLFISSWLVVYSIGQLNHFSAYKNWRTAEGRVTTSKVVGDRAFRPDVEYTYEVNGISYSGMSTLDMPGFGGRMNRLHMAETLSKMHPVGSRLTVYYNPEDPQQSLLIIHPPYSVYLKLASSAILFPLSLVLILLLVFAAHPDHKQEAQ